MVEDIYVCEDRGWYCLVALVGAYVLVIFFLWTKLSFCFGGLITLFHCFIPRARFASYHYTREDSKRVCAHFSLHHSLRLVKVPAVLGAVFLSCTYKTINTPKERLK